MKLITCFVFPLLSASALAGGLFHRGGQEFRGPGGIWRAITDRSNFTFKDFQGVDPDTGHPVVWVNRVDRNGIAQVGLRRGRQWIWSERFPQNAPPPKINWNGRDLPLAWNGNPNFMVRGSPTGYGGQTAGGPGGRMSPFFRPEARAGLFGGESPGMAGNLLGLLISGTIRGSPSENLKMVGDSSNQRYTLEPGDIITRIGNVAFSGMNTVDALHLYIDTVQSLRGKQVPLTVRDASGKEAQFLADLKP